MAGFRWNQWQRSPGMEGRFAVESVATFVWNRWQVCCGISGRFTVEYACSTRAKNQQLRSEPRAAPTPYASSLFHCSKTPILAGSPPLVAIRYQIVVACMLAAATAVSSLLFVRLAVRRYLTPAH